MRRNLKLFTIFMTITILFTLSLVLWADVNPNGTPSQGGVFQFITKDSSADNNRKDQPRLQLISVVTPPPVQFTLVTPTPQELNQLPMIELKSKEENLLQFNLSNFITPEPSSQP